MRHFDALRGDDGCVHSCTVNAYMELVQKTTRTVFFVTAFISTLWARTVARRTLRILAEPLASSTPMFFPWLIPGALGHYISFLVRPASGTVTTHDSSRPNRRGRYRPSRHRQTRQMQKLLEQVQNIAGVKQRWTFSWGKVGPQRGSLDCGVHTMLMARQTAEQGQPQGNEIDAEAMRAHMALELVQGRVKRFGVIRGLGKRWLTGGRRARSKQSKRAASGAGTAGSTPSSKSGAAGSTGKRP